jgi:hypothetical protein
VTARDSWSDQHPFLPALVLLSFESKSLLAHCPLFLMASVLPATENNHMKNHAKILFSILVAAMCTVSFAADKPAGCKKSGKNCPMNDNKECNCGKACDCKAPGKPQ